MTSLVLVILARAWNPSLPDAGYLRQVGGGTGTGSLICTTGQFLTSDGGQMSCAGVLTADGGSLGSVTGVTGTAPIVSSGGSAPAISVACAGATDAGIVCAGAQSLPSGTKSFTGDVAVSNALSSGTLAVTGLSSFGPIGAGLPTSYVYAGGEIESGPVDLTGVNAGTNRNGQLRTGSFKVTVNFTAWTAAALAQDITLAVMPAGTRVLSVVMDHVAAFNSGHTNLSVGITGKPEDFLLKIDCGPTALTRGLADVELGTNFVRAARIQNGLIESWTGGTNLILSATNGGFAGGNLGNGSVTNFLQGSTVVYVTYEAIK